MSSGDARKRTLKASTSRACLEDGSGTARLINTHTQELEDTAASHKSASSALEGTISELRELETSGRASLKHTSDELEGVKLKFQASTAAHQRLEAELKASVESSRASQQVRSCSHCACLSSPTQLAHCVPHVGA